jgi:formylglycine-generating enzyme required for sulfatase activity
MGADQDAQAGAMVGGVNVGGYDEGFAGYDGSNSIDDYASYSDNSDTTGDGTTTHPVGDKLPNELGLYDMSGNVGEWNRDWSWSPVPGGEQTDYRGAA